MKGILFLVHVIGDGLEGAALFLSDERRPEPQVQVVLEVFGKMIFQNLIACVFHDSIISEK